MTSFAERWEANADRYADDIVTFAGDQWVIRDAPPNMTLGVDNTVRLLPHQIEILREMFRRDDAGNLVYDEMIWSTIKKSGKTEIEGIVAEWAALTFEGTPEIYFVGNDKEQAQTRAFAAIASQINPDSKAFNPVVAQHFIKPRIFGKSLDQLDYRGGGFLKSIPVDYAGEAGSNPLASMWDELWGVDRESQRRLWDEMTPPPTRRNAFRFVATYAGFWNESDLLRDLFERIVGKPGSRTRRKNRIHPTLPLYVQGKSIAYWDEGIEARRMPWQTEAYYKSEKNKNRPEMFNRIHMNLWQTHAEAFIKPEQWDALERHTRAVPNSEGYPVYITVDAAHKRDTCFAVAVEVLPEFTTNGRRKVRVVDMAVWRPVPGQRVVVPEDTALPWVRRGIESWNVKAVGFDPAHFETPAQRLRDEYPTLDVIDITQSVANLTRVGQSLYDAVGYQALVVFPESETDEDALRSHVLNAVARQTPTGYRVVKDDKDNKIDGAVALGMGLMLASERGERDLERHSVIYISGADDDEDYV